MEKQENRRIIISCSSLFEFTEIKIAGKRRIEPEWSSQTGVARMEQSDWRSQDGAGSILTHLFPFSKSKFNLYAA